MSKKIILILALVIVLSAFALSQYDTIDTGYAKSTPRHVGNDCPDSKITYKAYQKTTGNYACKQHENNGWVFVEPLEVCGCVESKEPTSTSKPVVVVPTATPATRATDNAQPTSTQPSNSDNRSNPTVTLTPTYVTGEHPAQICNWCDLQSTDTAAQATQASAQSTIAAQLSKGE